MNIQIITMKLGRKTIQYEMIAVLSLTEKNQKMRMKKK